MQFVTSGSLAYFQAHGEKFISSFLSCVDPSITLRIYGEWSKEGVGPTAYVPKANSRISFTDLFTDTLLERYLAAAKPVVEKRIGKVSANPKERLSSKTYDYRFDALTFGKKVLAVTHGMRLAPYQTVIWCDLDVQFHRPMGPEFVESLFQGKDLFYFGRANQHSETGFMGFHTNSEGVRELASRMETCLVSLAFMNLPGWTDCHIFDHARIALEKQKRLKSVDLSKGQDGHVIARSCLAPYLDHMKGPRKFAGSSPEREAHLRKAK